MKSKLQKQQKGFTIIEVLIVLAIAGLIILIVFLAVPALQRNSRNTQRKNDVSALLGAVSEYQSNRAGKLPVVWDSADTEFQNAAADVNGTGTEASLSVYGGGDVTYAANSNTAVTTALGKVFINGGAKCNTAGNNVGGSNASSRSVAAVYTVENANGVTDICQES